MSRRAQARDAQWERESEKRKTSETSIQNSRKVIKIVYMFCDWWECSSTEVSSSKSVGTFDVSSRNSLMKLALDTMNTFFASISTLHLISDCFWMTDGQHFLRNETIKVVTIFTRSMQTKRDSNDLTATESVRKLTEVINFIIIYLLQRRRERSWLINLPRKWFRFRSGSHDPEPAKLDATPKPALTFLMIACETNQNIKWI